MPSIRKASTIAWPGKLPVTKLWHRASITLDDAGSFALVRYLDVHRRLLHGLLWDLAKGTAVAGDHVELHPRAQRAVRRTAKGAEVVDTASGRVIAQLQGAVDVSLSPDATFAVQRLRADSPPKTAARPTTRVFRIPAGTASELPTRSVLEAFVAGGRLATVSDRGAVTIWDLATGTAVGKLGGLAKPASIRVDPSGTLVALSARDGKFAVYDVSSTKAIVKGASKIIFNGDVRFDGERFVGTNIAFDVKHAKATAKGWLDGEESHGREEAAVLTYPQVALLTQRSILDDQVVELWDVEAKSKVSSTSVQPRADALASAGKKLVVAHLPADDEEWPALTVFNVGGATSQRARPTRARSPRRA